MKNRKFLFIATTAVIICCGLLSCNGGGDVWSSADAWFQYEGSNPEPREDWADVFYLVSTNIISERDERGDTLYRASLTSDQKNVLSQEIGYVAKHVFGDSLNFFSPFYHQHTMEAIDLNTEAYGILREQVADEVYEAFCYYLDNFNRDRQYILAGFSQGAMLVKEILKRLTPEQYSRMAAAYLMGWGLNEADTTYPYIRPAQSAYDRGVTISYNTVTGPDGIWAPVMDDASFCINPVNWTTDGTPANFEYKGQSLQVQLDTTLDILTVSNFTPEALPFSAPWQDGCLHHYEFLFYEKQLCENAKNRAYHRTEEP